MCGFVGILTTPQSDSEELRTRIKRMNSRLHHRGPDDEGLWVDGPAGVALGFRRLSIQDLSPLGNQPMESRSGRFIVSFNGEIYNFIELANQLRRKGHSFRGSSDTEVILAGIEEWGLERALDHFVGMFALAVWDRAQRRMSLVRDRLGIKPLYYSWRPGLILFGSEIKALRADPEFDPTLNPEALSHFLKYLHIPAPLSIFQAVKKLPPGHILTVDRTDQEPPGPRSFWNLREIAQNGVSNPLPDAYPKLVSALEEQLSEAIRIRLRSDVPLGVLLSGGIDSSTVAALAQSHLGDPIKTFSIGFDSAEHDESRHAKAVAEAIGTEHEELFVNGSEVLAAIPKCAEIFDEPFADPSQIPTFLVSQLAKRKVTVALSGDGGDELFGGYNRYIRGPWLISRTSRIPLKVRKALRGLLSSMPPRQWSALLRRSGLGGDGRLLGEKVHKVAEVLRANSPWGMYLSLLGVGLPSPASVLKDPGEFDDIYERDGSDPLPPGSDQMMLCDQLVYLPDDLLAKVDRASMATSLEVRVPILDHRVVEFAWSLPAKAKINGGIGKRILRDVLYRSVPRELVERPKVGFTPPTAEWLRGPLKGWASDLLDQERIARQGIFDPRAVNLHWETFLNDRDDLSLGTWALVQFQAWADLYLHAPVG